MCRTLWPLVLMLFAAGVFQPLQAQDSTRTEEALRVFLDCEDCDFVYIRRQIPWVNHVRDRETAQVHVLVTDQPTGSGGRSFNLAFIGREAFTGQDYTLRYVSAQSDTEDEERQGFTRVLKMGLMPYVSQTAYSESIEIDYRADAREERTLTPHDPWNNWVFRMNLGTFFDKEQRENQLSLFGGLSVNRVTEQWKWQNSVSFDYDEEHFKDDDEWIDNIRRSGAYNTIVVYSLSRHWSAGVYTGATTSTFSNILLGLHAAPAIEFNVFPWEESDRKVLTVLYRAGVRSYDYEERTLYGKTRETLGYQALSVGLGLNQPWGEARVRLEGSNYLHDWSKRRLEMETDLEFRITRGLSMELEVSLERIHDQLYLPEGDATLEEILLRQRQLATTYEVSGGISLQYTFGSIYNNVVNLRL